MDRRIGMRTPTLLVLAAGMGSRYGGIKQMDPVGPEGEFVIDYSIYDAWRAGFRSVVFVIRKELEAPLREHFSKKLDGKMDIAFTCQELTDMPEGFCCPPMRKKPWGTGQAVWAARKLIPGNFAVINADDFYGGGAYKIMAQFLTSKECDEKTYAMVGYRLGNTLSEYGSVSRGICTVHTNGFLADVTERTCIEKTSSGARCLIDGKWKSLTGEELCSLNLWGFHTSLFHETEKLFQEFLTKNSGIPKAEFFIPSVVDSLVKTGDYKARVLPTDEHWFGMTYKEDRQLVVHKISELTKAGDYPAHLW